MKKRVLWLIGFLALISLTLGFYFHRKPNQLAILTVHEKAVYGMTPQELVNRFGAPQKIERNQQKVQQTWQQQNETEGFMEELPTEFFQTMRREKGYQPQGARHFTAYYQYESHELTSIRFFVQENRVRDIVFGEPKAGKQEAVQQKIEGWYEKSD